MNSDRYANRRRWLLVVASWAVFATGTLLGCSSDSSADPPDTPVGASTDAEDAAPTTAARVPIDEGGPLLGLPACEPPPEGVDADVEGLVLPDGAVITDVQDQGQLINVRGYVEQTPIQVRQFYADEPGLELFELEDETYEAEVLFGGAKYNSYVKVQAQCQQGSSLLVFVGPGDSGDLPSLGGG